MNSKASARLILMATCSAMVWLVRAALDMRSLLACWDLGGHVLRAHFLATVAIHRPGFTAWFPSWHGGFPLSEVYPPLTTWLLAPFVPLGLDVAVARLILVAAWVSIVPCSYYFLRSFELERVPAAVAAALTMALNSPLTFGSYAIFSLGLLPNALGFLWAVLSMGALQRLLSRPSGAGAARAALFGGLTLLAHPFAAVWAAAGWISLWLSHRVTQPARGATPAFILAGAWALAIGSFYWLPFMANRANLLITEPFPLRSAGDVWRSVLLLEDMGGPAAVLLTVVGLACATARAHRTRLTSFLFLLATGLILATGLLSPLLRASSLFGKSQWARFEGFYGWTALVTGGLAVEAAFSVGTAGALRRKFAAAIAVAAVLGVAGASVRDQRPVSGVTPAPERSMERMAGALAPHLRPGDFILTEDSAKAAGVLSSPHFLHQRLPLINPAIWDQGGSLPEGTFSSEPFLLMSTDFVRSIGGARDDLAAGGVRFLGSVERASRDVLQQIPWLTLLWADSAINGLALFEVDTAGRRFGLPAALSTRIDRLNFSARDGYVLSFVDAQKLSYPLSTAVSYHPWLVVSADGQSVETRSGPLRRLVLVDGPAEATRIEIRYVPPPWIAPVRWLSLAFLLGAGALLFRRPQPRNFMRAPTENP